MPRSQTAPPPLDYFGKARPAFGDERLTISLEPLQLELTGLDEPLRELLFERYTPYSRSEATSDDLLRVRVEQAGVEHFIARPEGLEFVQVRIACEGQRVRFMSYQVAGWFDIQAGEGQLLLASDAWEPRQRSFENYIRAAVAWQAAGRGGALVHAASAVHEGKGYLFYGESGAGKSTLSACNRRGIVLSDDLSLVLPADDGTLEVVGSPFRGTYEGGDPVQGHFPLAAGFRLIQAPEAGVRDVPRSRAFAELVGNFPFVAEAFAERPDLFATTLASFAQLPLAHLHFAKDDSYWDAIRDAGY